eukprot:COSAG01_NODE_2020_length_8634_cov_4.835735_9_plen_237_part_00
MRCARALMARGGARHHQQQRLAGSTVAAATACTSWRQQQPSWCTFARGVHGGVLRRGTGVARGSAGMDAPVPPCQAREGCLMAGVLGTRGGLSCYRSASGQPQEVADSAWRALGLGVAMSGGESHVHLDEFCWQAARGLPAAGWAVPPASLAGVAAVEQQQQRQKRQQQQMSGWAVACEEDARPWAVPALEIAHASERDLWVGAEPMEQPSSDAIAEVWEMSSVLKKRRAKIKKHW